MNVDSEIEASNSVNVRKYVAIKEVKYRCKRVSKASRTRILNVGSM